MSVSAIGLTECGDRPVCGPQEPLPTLRTVLRRRRAQKVLLKLKKNTLTPVCVVAALAVASVRWLRVPLIVDRLGATPSGSLRLRHTQAYGLVQTATWAWLAWPHARQGEPERQTPCALSRTCDSHTTQMDARLRKRQTQGPGRHAGGWPEGRRWQGAGAGSREPAEATGPGRLSAKLGKSFPGRTGLQTGVSLHSEQSRDNKCSWPGAHAFHRLCV